MTRKWIKRRDRIKALEAKLARARRLIKNIADEFEARAMEARAKIAKRGGE